MKEIALHLLDLAENSVAAAATQIKIQVHEDLSEDRLTASVTDDGRGMDSETLHKVIDPFYSSRKTRTIGLGLPLLKEAAEATGGRLEIGSSPTTGTKVDVIFQLSHIDRMPLGNLASTFLTLMIMHPDVHWHFEYSATDGISKKGYEFDDQPVKELLGEIPLTDPQVLAYLRKQFEDGLASGNKILHPE